jgi:hypothetical protein
MKTSRASSHAVHPNSVRPDVTFVPPVSARMKRFLLGLDAKLNPNASCLKDANLILTDWLQLKFCSFDRLAIGRVRRALCAANPRRAELDAARPQAFFMEIESRSVSGVTKLLNSTDVSC